METPYETQTVAVSEILHDDYYQHRDTTVDKSLPFLREVYKAGVRFKDVDLLKLPDGKYQIIAGFQRVKITRQEGDETATVEARVYSDISTAEAMRISVRSNKCNGTALSTADKRHAIQCLLREDPHMTDAEIHDITSAPLRTIAYQRNKVPGAKTTVRHGRDGKLKTAKPIKKKEVKEPNLEKITNNEISGETDGSTSYVQSELFEENAEKPVSSGLVIALPKQTEAIPGLRTLVSICRMQAKELEQRASLIEKMNDKGHFNKEELQLIEFLAEDAEALELADSRHWDERSAKIKAISIFISQILVSSEEEECTEDGDHLNSGGTTIYTAC